MIALVLVGGLVGAGLSLLVWQLVPARLSSAVLLGRFDAARHSQPQPEAPAGDKRRSLIESIGASLVAALARRGVKLGSLRADLALTGGSLNRLMGTKVLAAVACFLLSLAVLTGYSQIAGAGLPGGASAATATVVSAAAFLLPDVDIRRNAARRRREFRRAMGAWMDLVSLEMAGSAAATQALPHAAQIGAGWPLLLIRDTLSRGVLSGTGQWDALSELGHRIGVSEMVEVAEMVRHVSTDGAKVRATLSARAASMRAAALAETQGMAGKREDSMRMAEIVIMLGFMVFLGYPAIAAVAGM